MTDVVLPAAITEIPEYAFAGCNSLVNINLENVVKINDYAFIENKALAEVNLPVAETIGEYAFVYCENLTALKLSEACAEIGEGTFSYCEQLAQVENLNAVKNIGDYAFAYTALTEVDLSGAESIGSLAFLKEEFTPFQVTLGEELTVLGDNPFAMCLVEPFGITETSTFNTTEVTTANNTYDISKSVRVIDGSLYCDTINGMELITFAGTETQNFKIAEDTVRVSAYAFAGSDVEMVTLPVVTNAIGHKAFFGCEKLHTVIFGSQVAPVLEEEYDSTYYESLEHIPGTGDFGTYTDYNGNEVEIQPMGLVPYFMWNATGGLYSNVYYGANFVDYVGYVEDKLTMVRPVNGEDYDTFIMGQYFDVVIDGPAAPDKTTLAAIKAIKAIPEKVGFEDAALVEAARAAYTKIATLQQQALVTNYADLISAEQRIIALTPTEEGAEGETVEDETTVEVPETKNGIGGLLLILGGTLAVIGGYFAIQNKAINLENLKKINLKDIKLKKIDFKKVDFKKINLKDIKLKPALKNIGAWFAKIGTAAIQGCVKGFKWIGGACAALIAKLPKKAKAEAKVEAEVEAEAETEENETVNE